MSQHYQLYPTVKFNFLDCSEISYPVGNYISANLDAIKAMAKAIHSAYYDKELFLWCRGSSGAIIAGIIASRIPNYVVINHIKKEGENSHGSLTKPGIDAVNIIVDDFIRSGETIDTIALEMSTRGVKPDCLCVSGRVTTYFLRKHNIASVICRVLD